MASSSQAEPAQEARGHREGQDFFQTARAEATDETRRALQSDLLPLRIIDKACGAPNTDRR